MRTFLIATLLVCITTHLYSQETGNDTYTIQRLIIKNEKGEILLQKHANGWMTPALRHNTEKSTDEALSELAMQFGLEVTKPQLQGIFMYFHSDNKKPSFRQHYTCQTIGGAFKTPSDMLDAQWFSAYESAKKMIDPNATIVVAVGEMTKQILLYPSIIWGGSYMLVKEEGKKTKSEMIENFYPIGLVND